MKRLLLLISPLVLLVTFAAFAGQPPVSTTPGIGDQSSCLVAHQDQAVNTQVTLTLVPGQGQSVYICGWDYTVAQDGTGTAQTNVLWQTDNLNNLSSEYSTSALPNSFISGNYQYIRPVRAQSPGFVRFRSPAAATHNAYSLNVYYYFGPAL